MILNVPVTNTISTVFVQSDVLKVKPKVYRTGIKFYNKGDDVVLVNDVRLYPNDSIINDGGGSFSFDETKYRIKFEDLLPNKYLVVEETVLLRIKKFEIK